jgi:high-affinity nickel-transport protein
MADLSFFLAAAVPVMVLLGIRHALDVDHIAAIDNLVRMRSAVKSARWIGSLFSAGHMLAVCAEMVALVYVVKSLEAQASLQVVGGVLGACVLALIGGINLYSLRRYGRSGFGMLAMRLARMTRFAGSAGSPLLIGFVFGLGFDTATQVSALAVSAVASATQGVQVALLLSGFFAAGMVPTDTLDSLVLREVFSRINNSGGFKSMSVALSVLALSIASLEATGVAVGVDLLPPWSGALLAVTVITAGLSYGLARKGSHPPGPAGRPFAHEE